MLSQGEELGSGGGGERTPGGGGWGGPHGPTAVLSGDPWWGWVGGTAGMGLASAALSQVSSFCGVASMGNLCFIPAR